ncbi:MAG: hypothetical protein ACE5IP_01040 [Terriglobia bacterium]
MRYTLSLIALLLAGTLSLVGGDLPTQAGTLSGTFKSVWLRKYPMVVYLEKVDGNFKPAREKPVIDQKNKMFVPHVVPAVKGTTVRYLNHDDTKHNIYFIQPDGKKVNLGTGTANWSKEHQMDQAGVYVHRCNIHDEMSAFVVVLDNPYYALIGKRASKKPAGFKIEGVPAGQYKLRVWCEKFFAQEGHKFNRTWDVSIKAGEETTVALKP